MMSDVVYKILGTSEKSYAKYPGASSLQDMINFGFSFVESEDHMVTSVVTNNEMMTRILRESEDAYVEFDGEALGTLLTAKLYVHGNIKGQRIIFANVDYTTVLVLDADHEIEIPDKEF